MLAILLFTIFLIHILCIANNLTTRLSLLPNVQAYLLGISLVACFVLLGWKVYTDYYPLQIGKTNFNYVTVEQTPTLPQKQTVVNAAYQNREDVFEEEEDPVYASITQLRGKPNERLIR